ncbi:MAG: right-handed parallel beta-helix repeat-containing protein [Planctomycetes bacterium]|nr:right-handed parallel beta-helix repeat-containing protein [Planctomycetota bacterium]
MRKALGSLVIAASFVLASCAGGGGSGGAGGLAGPSGPAVMTLSAAAGDAQITFTFNTVSGATGYTLYYATAGGVTPFTGTPVPMTASPFTLPGLTNGTTYYAVATYTDAAGESAPSAQASATPQLPLTGSPYDPGWGSVVPTTVVSFTGTASQLEAAMNALTPGDKLEIANGTYNLTSKFNLDVQGTVAAPIWITPAPGATVTLNMTATQNVMNVGENSQTRYLCIRGLKINGTSHGVRFYNCTQVWFDGNEVFNVGGPGVTTNTFDTSYMYITRNDIHDTGGHGEGMYLGANGAAVIMSNSIIALNHVHDCYGTGPNAQGDGIEIKQGSWGNLVAENHVHDTNQPCILLYGTGGQAQNIVERNICYRCNDNAMQIQGECIVRNNLCISASASTFASQFHEANPTNIQVIHNTFINTSTAAKLSAWGGASNMVFANNACYSQSGSAISQTGGVSGVTFAGNVCVGTVGSGISGTIVGNGLSDFVNVSWNGTNTDAHLTAASACKSAASATHATTADLEGATRTAPHDAGCYED